MFVSLSQQTEKMGERMNSAMNHRRGGVFQKMIMRTDPVIMKMRNGKNFSAPIGASVTIEEGVIN